MSIRPLTLLLAACALGAPAFAERVDRDRDGRDIRNPHAAAAKDPDQDDATARRAAMREWWGDYTPEYRQFLMEAAARERELNGALIPGSGRFLPVRAAGSTWTSLGPTSANVEWNGSTYTAIDSGRPVSIVVDPTNASIIYNATSDGGVWKTTDGGSTWSPITEGLGSLSCGYLTMDPSNHNTLYLGLGDSFDGTGIGLVKSTDAGATWSAPVFLGSSTMVRDVKVSSTNNQVVIAATNAGLFRSTNGGASFSKVSIATGAAGDPSCWTLAWGGGSNWALSLESDTTITTGSGQIWYSSDDGATWTQSTGFAQATVGLTRASIASAPSSRTTMYAYAAGSKSWSTTDAGQDLADFYRSTDAGHTWTAFAVGGSTKQYTNTNSDSTYVRNILGGQAWYNQMIIVDPSNAGTVYAGGNLALVKITGANATPSYTVMSNWLAQYSQPYIHADFHAGTIDQNGTLYMGTDGGIFKQTSAASNTWTSNLNIGIVSHLCYSVGSSLANRNVVIGGLQDNGTRVRSGSTSVFDQTLGGDGFGVNVHPTNASTMMGSLYYSRVYKSTTGGTAGSFAQSTSGITEAGNSSTGVFITRITPGLGDSTGNTLYTFSTFKVYKSTNYAGSWTAAGAAPISSGTIRNVGAAKSNTAVIGAVCSGGRAFLSSNSGTSWTAIPTTALTGNGSSLSYISFSPANSNVVYIASVAPGSTNTHLWRSTNFGSTWAAMDTAPGFPAGIPVNCILEDPNDSQTLYAGTHQGVYRSIDGGSTWSRFGSGMPLVNVTDLYIAPDSSLVRASTFGRGFWELTGSAANTVTASITTPSADQTIASGSSVSFAGSATDSSSSATLSYAWDFGDGGTATGTSTSHTYTNTGSSNVTYTAKFTATDETSASGSATRLITVTPAPTAPSITSQPASVTVTAPATATFSVTASGTAPLSYQWRKNGTAISGATSASYTTPATATTDSGSTFSVVVTNSAGSATSNNATLTVNAPAALAATVSAPSGNVTVASGAAVTFTGSASGGTSPYTYSWAFGDGGTSTAASTSHTYTNTGSTNATFTATFKVTDNAGATSTVTRTITVTPAPVSTTFTEVEANNTIATANVVGSSYTAITGNLTTTTDVDYFALTLAPGQKITIAMTGPTGPDWDLYLKNSAGTTLASSTGSTTTENLSYTNTGTTSMTVYPEVIVYATASTSPYNLALTYSAVTPANTVTASITTPSSNVTIASGTSQSFVGTATDSSSTATLTYAWNFGDGSTGSGASTSHTYTNTGTSNATYTATLTATDNTGVSNSTTRTITVTPAPTGSELILNGGFESGATSWSGTTGDIGTFSGQPTHGGTMDCWLDGNGSAATESIQQSIAVPAAGANLTFWLHIDTAETTTTTAYDTLKVQVLNASGTVLGTLATYSNLNKATGYSQKSLSLAAYAGQTVTIKFLGVEDASLQTSFVIDDVSAK